MLCTECDTSCPFPFEISQVPDAHPILIIAFRCSTDAPGGRCVLNPSARPQPQPGSDIGIERRRGLQELSDRRKRHSISKAGIMDRLRRASEAVARPGDEVLDL